MSARAGRKDSWYCRPCKNAKARTITVNVRAEYDSGEDLARRIDAQLPADRKTGTPDIPVPDGFHVRAVSTLHDAEGEVVQRWVKASRDGLTIDAILESVLKLAEPIRGSCEPTAAPEIDNDDLITVFPAGDPHFGLYAWAPESGDNFDLEIAERDTIAAMERLVMVAPASREAIFAPLGDNFTADGGSNATTAGTPQDVDGRWPKVLDVVIRCMRRCIDLLLSKHHTVHVKIVRGNHDEWSSLVLATCLAMFYEREPRVIVDRSPMHFLWHRFGKCLFGFTHGDRAKPADLPGVMACDRKEDWGQTEHRHFYTGHIHHDTVKEFPGVIVETFRTLAAKDKYHASHGYRSGRDMKCDVWHREYGRITRHSVGIMQLRSGR